MDAQELEGFLFGVEAGEDDGVGVFVFAVDAAEEDVVGVVLEHVFVDGAVRGGWCCRQKMICCKSCPGDDGECRTRMMINREKNFNMVPS